MLKENENRYRRATPADIEKIKELTLKSYLQYAHQLTDENIKAWEQSMSNTETYEQLFSKATCFVCERNNFIIGSVFIIRSGNPWAWFDKEWAYIRLLAVDPNEGGKGIGKKLAQLCVEEAMENGEQVLALHTSEFQPAARHIYETMGFEKMKDLEKVFDRQYYLYTLKL